MGTGSDWHWALDCSALLINHNQSGAITSIFFGQLPRRSGGAALHRSLWYVGTAETSGAAEPGRENKNKMDRKKKRPQVHLNPCRHPTIRDGVSLIIYSHCCVLPVSTNRRGSMDTRGETCNLFPSVKMKSRYTETIRSRDYSLLRCKTWARPLSP